MKVCVRSIRLLDFTKNYYYFIYNSQICPTLENLQYLVNVKKNLNENTFCDLLKLKMVYTVLRVNIKYKHSHN